MRGRVAILTGRSDPCRTGLHPELEAFLSAVVPGHLAAVRQGFPWVEGAPPERAIWLPLAAIRNARMWRAAYRDRAFQEQASSALNRLRADKPLALITGSCGLDILAQAWRPGLAQQVIALGPVTRGQPDLEGAHLHRIVGRRDWLSRTLHRPAPGHIVPCSHMGYWTCPDTQRITAEILRAWAP